MHSMVDERIRKEELAEKEMNRRFFADTLQGVFVDVRANEPVSIFSQTWHLEQRGRTGILVEPFEPLHRECVKKRPGSRSFQVACSSPDKIGTAELKVPYVAGKIDTGKAALETDLDHGGFEGCQAQKVEVTTLR